MNNLDIANTTSFILLKGGQDGGKISRTTASKKIKLRPTSKSAIEENLSKIPSIAVSAAPTENSSVVNEAPAAVAPTVTSESSAQKITFVLFPERVYWSTKALPKGLKLKVEKAKTMVSKAPVPVVPTDVKVDVEDLPTEQLSLDEIKDGDKVAEQVSEVAPTPTVAEVTEAIDRSETTGLYGTMSLGGVLSVENNQPKEEVKEESLVTPAEEETTVLASESSEPVVAEVDEVPKETVSLNDSTVPAVENTDSLVEEELTQENTAPVLKETSEKLLDEEPINVSVDSEKKDVTPVYELCEAVDAQRIKTKEALDKVNQLTRDLENYKEEAQKKIDESNREVLKAGDDQTEAERRYQTAEQKNQAALKNLIDTGKNQQRLLQQKQREAEAQRKKIEEERKALEDSNQVLLARNEERIQKSIDRTMELDKKTQSKNEEAAKWEAIARAMQDPEEDLMGFISPDDLYENQDAQVKSYGKRAA